MTNTAAMQANAAMITIVCMSTPRGTGIQRIEGCSATRDAGSRVRHQHVTYKPHICSSRAGRGDDSQSQRLRNEEVPSQPGERLQGDFSRADRI